MLLAHPLWLFLLLPWAAVALWLLWGRRRATAVPFLWLWPGDEPIHRARRWIELPFAALALALLASALAIIASAGPAILTHRPGGDKPITLILDRGITMSPPARWQSALEQARAAVDLLGPGPLDFVPVPDGRIEHLDRAGWLKGARQLAPLAIDTHEALALAVRQALARANGPVLVVSDHPVAADPKILQIAPSGAIEDVGITRLSVRRTPRPQVMIEIRNQSHLTSGMLILTSAGASTRETIELPPAGQSRNYFIEMPRLGQSVSATIEVSDDLPSNNYASVALHALWPAVQVRDPIPAAIRRIIDAYTQARPPGDGSAPVALISTADEVPPTQRAIILADDTSTAPIQAIDATVVSHGPLTEDVAWRDLKTAALSPAAPEGFEPIVRMNGQIVLAARRSPARQVWIGFDAPGFYKTTDFAVFWTRVLDWVGEAGPENFASISPPAVVIDPIQPAGWRQKAASLQAQMQQRIDLSRWLLLGSILCLLLAAGSWPRLTRFSPLRTV